MLPKGHHVAGKPTSTAFIEVPMARSPKWKVQFSTSLSSPFLCLYPLELYHSRKAILKCALTHRMFVDRSRGSHAIKRTAAVVCCLWRLRVWENPTGAMPSKIGIRSSFGFGRLDACDDKLLYLEKPVNSVKKCCINYLPKLSTIVQVVFLLLNVLMTLFEQTFIRESFLPPTKLVATICFRR